MDEDDKIEAFERNALSLLVEADLNYWMERNSIAARVSALTDASLFMRDPNSQADAYQTAFEAKIAAEAARLNTEEIYRHLMKKDQAESLWVRRPSLGFQDVLLIAFAMFAASAVFDWIS